jgi:hypothetical protein
MLVTVCVWLVVQRIKWDDNYANAAQHCFVTKVQPIALEGSCSIKGPYEYNAGTVTETRVFTFVKVCSSTSILGDQVYTEDYAFVACSHRWLFDDKDESKDLDQPICRATDWVQLK